MGMTMTGTATEIQILDAIRELGAYSDADWFSLAALWDTVRSHTTTTDRAAFTTALIALSRAGRILLTPEENQKTITLADERNAVLLGGVAQHLVARI